MARNYATQGGVATLKSQRYAVILRSRALARRLEGWSPVLVTHPSRLAAKCGEHLRMTKR
jgi:hypothetical protein